MQAYAEDGLLQEFDDGGVIATGHISPAGESPVTGSIARRDGWSWYLIYCDGVNDEGFEDQPVSVVRAERLYPTQAAEFLVKFHANLLHDIFGVLKSEFGIAMDHVDGDPGNSTLGSLEYFEVFAHQCGLQLVEWEYYLNPHVPGAQKCLRNHWNPSTVRGETVSRRLKRLTAALGTFGTEIGDAFKLAWKSIQSRNFEGRRVLKCADLSDGFVLDTSAEETERINEIRKQQRPLFEECQNACKRLVSFIENCKKCLPGSSTIEVSGERSVVDPIDLSSQSLEATSIASRPEKNCTAVNVQGVVAAHEQLKSSALQTDERIALTPRIVEFLQAARELDAVHGVFVPSAKIAACAWGQGKDCPRSFREALVARGILESKRVLGVTLTDEGLAILDNLETRREQ